MTKINKFQNSKHTLPFWIIKECHILNYGLYGMNNQITSDCPIDFHSRMRLNYCIFFHVQLIVHLKHLTDLCSWNKMLMLTDLQTEAINRVFSEYISIKIQLGVILFLFPYQYFLNDVLIKTNAYWPIM